MEIAEHLTDISHHLVMRNTLTATRARGFHATFDFLIHPFFFQLLERGEFRIRSPKQFLRTARGVFRSGLALRGLVGILPAL